MVGMSCGWVVSKNRINRNAKKLKMIQELIPIEILGLFLVAVAPRVPRALAEALE